MKIIVFNGSPRPQGNTAAMVEAFARGAGESGHEVTVVDVLPEAGGYGDFHGL